jgi:hypothetical protein
MPLVLLAALSLDGAWRTPEADPATLLHLLHAPARGPAWTDIPAFRRRRIPGLRWATHAAILAQVQLAATPSLAVLGTPALHAALLARGNPALALLWRAEVVVGGPRATLADPFLPPDGPRTRFRLRRTRAAAEGLACFYSPAGQKTLRR